jgi:pyrimidine nucleoside transport protein
MIMILTVAVTELFKLILQNCFVLQALSVIFFLSFMVQILYYYGAMQWVVFNLGWLLQKTMGTTVCESVNAAASIFLGQVII